MATAAQRKAFFDKIGPLAIQICNEKGYGDAQAWTCMCQAACESGYGTSALFKNANAYFGIKANQAWVNKGGKVYNSATKECYNGKTYVNITACFRAYNSCLDSVRDYFDFINGARYKASLSQNTVHDCITMIKNGGYATSPTYIQTIDNVFNTNKSYITAYKTKKNSNTSTTPVSSTTNTSYKYKNIDYSVLFDAKYYADSYADLKKAFGYDAKKLFSHFCTFGMKEHRKTSAKFDPVKYRQSYADLNKAFGDNWPKYYEHYVKYGVKEGRKAY